MKNRYPAIIIKEFMTSEQSYGNLAFLENAYDVSYSLKLGGVSRLSFSLPANDLKAQYIKPRAVLEFFDNDLTAGLFFVMSAEIKTSDEGAFFVVKCEHMVRRLYENILLSYKNDGEWIIKNQSTTAVINRILGAKIDSGKQKQTAWILDTCDFNITQYYDFEGMTMFSALMAVTGGWREDYMWKFDTTVYPYRLSLLKPKKQVTTELRCGKNLVLLKEGFDTKNWLNCVYVSGKSKDEVLTPNWARAQNTESADEYGLMEKIFMMKSIPEKARLSAAAQTYFEKYRDIPYTYVAHALDRYSLTEEESDRFIIGEYTRIILHDKNVTEGQIVEVSKADLTAKPGEVTLVIKTKKTL